MAGYEVVVLGGGPAGCATAISLVDHGIAAAQVLVIEASDYAEPRIGESIPPETRGLFAELGLLDAFLEQAHEPCHGSASSWGDDALGYNDALFNPFGYGWHLDRRRFDAWLAASVASRGVELRRGTRFLDVHGRGLDGVGLSVGQPGGEATRIEARFVVDAMGPRSRYAARVGAVPRTLDLLVSVSAQFELADGHAFTRMTMLEAVEQGWWYAARLPGDRIATALASSHALYKQQRFNDPRTWLETLARTRYIGPALAGCRPLADSFEVRTAPSFVLDRVYGHDWGEHWLAVGDAASAFDPISSRGVFKALHDGLHGGRAIAAALAGDGEALPAHDRAVQQRFVDYAQQRAFYYAQEQRWPDAPFWAERRAASLG